MAEGIAKALLGGTPSIEIQSAGLYAIPGNTPSKNAVKACLKHGIDIRKHRAQPVTPSLLTWADLIFCMERYQCQELQTFAHLAAPVRLIGENVPDIPDEIPDPYGYDLETYEQTFQSLTRAIFFHLGHLRERRKYDRKAEASG